MSEIQNQIGGDHYRKMAIARSEALPEAVASTEELGRR